MDKTKTHESKTLTNQLDLSGEHASKTLVLPNDSKTSKVSINSKFLLLLGLLVAIILFVFSKPLLAGVLLAGSVLIFLVLRITEKSKQLTATRLNSGDNRNNELKKMLFQTQYFENIENHGEKLYQQFEWLNEKYKHYLELLQTKFSPSELTYQRYYSPVAAIYDGLLDNFSKMAHSYKILSQIPIKELQRQLSNESPSENHKLILEKVELYQKQLSKTVELFNLNQKAIVELEKLSFALNDIKNSTTTSEAELKSLMKELQELADRAHKYSIN